MQTGVIKILFFSCNFVFLHLICQLRFRMKKTVYYFNPENDMALANFTPYYKVPAEIARMADDLSALPAWYALAGSVVKVGLLERVPCWEQLCNGRTPFPEVEWTDVWLDAPYSPWGWNPAFVHTLHKAGVSGTFFPSSEVLAGIRRLSGRVSGMEVLRQVATDDGLCGEACVCRSLEEVKGRLAVWGRCVLKAPWSGSGRGLVFVSLDTWTISVEGWTARMLRTQGAVTAEPVYNKVYDFAMEFYADSDGSVAFVGYSLFETDAFGNYKTNLLASDEKIEQWLSVYIPTERLYEVRRRLLQFLPDWLDGYYTGYLGIDMMVCRYSDGYALHPCVEVNLRMNMGVLSCLLFNRYVHPASQGRFVIEHYVAPGEALRFHERMLGQHPLRLESGKWMEGYVSLTPVSRDTHYQAYVLVTAKQLLND